MLKPSCILFEVVSSSIARKWVINYVMLRVKPFFRGKNHEHRKDNNGQDNNGQDNNGQYNNGQYWADTGVIIRQEAPGPLQDRP